MLRTASWRTLAAGRVGCGWPLTVCSVGEPKAEWLALKLPSRELGSASSRLMTRRCKCGTQEVCHEGETVVSHSVSPPQPVESAWLHGLFLRPCGGDSAVSPNTGTLTFVRPGHLRLSCVQHLTTLLLPLVCPFTVCAFPPSPLNTIRVCISHLWQNVFFQYGRLEKMSEDVTNEEHASCYKSLSYDWEEWSRVARSLCRRSLNSWWRGTNSHPAAHLEATRRTGDVPVSFLCGSDCKRSHAAGPGRHQDFQNVRSHQRIVEHNDPFPVSQVVKYRVQERISQPHVEVPVPQMVEDSVEATQLQQALLRSADCLLSHLSPHPGGSIFANRYVHVHYAEFFLIFYVVVNTGVPPSS